MTSTAIEYDLELLILEVEDHEVACESHAPFCVAQGGHRADWYALSPCGSVAALCERRRVLMRNVGTWRCGAHRERYEDIEWTPIK